MAYPFGRGAAGGRAGADDDVSGGQPMLGVPKRFADEAPKPVARDRIANDFGADRKAQPRAAGIVAAYHERKTRVAEPTPVPISGFEVFFSQQSARGRKTEAAVGWRVRIPTQGISFLRPLARRRAKTLRPFAVAMRARNPWVRARRTLLG